MAQPKRSRIESWKQAFDRLKNHKGDYNAQHYAPYISIHDFSSVGRVSRTKFAGRVVHTMSDLETGLLRELQWAGATYIFDQVALADFEKCNVDETVEIARRIGVDHSVHKRDLSPSVMTTDIVAKYFSPGAPPSHKLHAFAVKPTSAVTIDRTASAKRQREAERTIEKLEIERRFWASKGVKWSLVTSDDIDPIRVRNIEFLLTASKPIWPDNEVGQILELLSAVDPDTKILDLWTASGRLEPEFWNAGSAVDCLRWFVSTRQIQFKLDVPFGSQCRVRDFDISEPVSRPT